MDALFLAELNERLFVHFIAGRWRVPQGARLVAAPDYGRGRLGRIACADAGDVDAALAALRPAAGGGLLPPVAPDPAGLTALRALEGFDDPPADPPPLPPLPGTGPLLLLSAAATPVWLLVALLRAGASRGVLWKPAPAAAASAHLVMRGLGPAAGGALALVQGDHATGAAAIARAGAVIWASDAPPPCVPALSLGARCRPRP